MADKQPEALRAKLLLLADEYAQKTAVATVMCMQGTSAQSSMALNAASDVRRALDAELVRQHALIAELVGALEKACDEEQQARFEHWLAGEAPSGDVEDVQRQWLNSYAYQGYCDDWCRVIDALAKAKEAQQ